MCPSDNLYGIGKIKEILEGHGYGEQQNIGDSFKQRYPGECFDFRMHDQSVRASIKQRRNNKEKSKHQRDLPHVLKLIRKDYLYSQDQHLL
jgi:hypothetical protein